MNVSLGMVVVMAATSLAACGTSKPKHAPGTPASSAARESEAAITIKIPVEPTRKKKGS